MARKFKGNPLYVKVHTYCKHRGSTKRVGCTRYKLRNPEMRRKSRRKK